MTLVMVVDDVPAMAEQYAYDLRRLGGYEVHVAQDGRQALERLGGEPVDCVILDLEMPGMDGFEVLRALERRGSEVPVIVYTGTGDFDRCIQAVRLGAYGFIDKAEPIERIVREIELAIERRRLRAELQSLRRRLDGESTLVGTSAAMVRLQEQIARVAPVPSTVLIVGESGTGKELVARELHRLGAQPAGPFVALNCGGPPRAPGRERAVRPRAGRVHRRERHPEGRVRGGRAGHPVPRRDRRAAARRRRPSCSACWRSARSRGSAARRRSPWRRGSSRRPTATWRRRSRPGGSGRTSTTGSTSTRSWSRRCASGGATCRRSPSGSPPRSARASASGPSGSPPDTLELLMGYDWARNNVRELRNVVERMIIAADGEVIGPDQVPA